MKPTYASFFANLSDEQRHSTISSPSPSIYRLPQPTQTIQPPTQYPHPHYPSPPSFLGRARRGNRALARYRPTPKSYNFQQIAFTEDDDIETYLTSDESFLDFFYESESVYEEMLQLAWEHDTRKTLKLICNLKDDSIVGVPYFPRMGFTENYSGTYFTSNNPCLDFFFHIVPGSSSRAVRKRLELAWAHDPVKTLKLVCNLRGVRGTGKSDKENFYTAALWLHENHPKTLACNVKSFTKFGYFKDLPEILFRLLEGSDVRKKRKDAWSFSRRNIGKGEVRKLYFLRKKSKKEKTDIKEKVIRRRLRARLVLREQIVIKMRSLALVYVVKRYDADVAKKMEGLKIKEILEKRRLRASVPREERVAANAVKVKEEMEKARRLRHEKDANLAKRHEERYEYDDNYRLLHDCVTRLFAKMLRSDLRALNSGNVNKISLAAKWCPTIDSAYDKATLLCKSISKQIFPYEEYQFDSEEQYVYKIRNRLRKEFLVPLHKALKLPEVYMSAKQWGSVSYERVPSIAMRNYTDVFMHRDKGRFKEYLENVEGGNLKIAAGALLPHEIIEKNSVGSRGDCLVSELQWKRMVDDLSRDGKMTNCIAVCDVSRSMSGTPMEVCVALGLLVSELSEEPWRGHVITFSREPKLHIIGPGNLKSKVDSIKKMGWGMNTDFQKVFDRILEVAVNGKLRKDKMIKRVFVFSDMEFDKASAGPDWETDYMVIQRKFRAKGFRNVPEIVFWNLRSSRATPVTATENGVALVSGFSKNLLKLFLEEGGTIQPHYVSSLEAPKMNPEAIMDAAISGEMYKNLVVYD